MNRALYKKNVSLSVLILFLSIFTFSPILSHAAQSNQTDTGITYECGQGITAGECDFQDLLNAIKNIVRYGVTLTLSLSVVVIAYAGFLYMQGGANPAKRTQANKMLQKVAIGIFFIMAAWLIVSLILRALGVDSPVEFK